MARQGAADAKYVGVGEAMTLNLTDEDRYPEPSKRLPPVTGTSVVARVDKMAQPSRGASSLAGKMHAAGKPQRAFILSSLILISTSHLMPTAAGALLTVLGLVGGFVLWFRVPAGRTVEDQRGYWPIVFAGAIILYWAVNILNANVPSLNIGVEGFRKSVLAVAGVAWGCSVRRCDREWVERAVISILLVMMTVSVAAFIWLPNLVLVSTDAVLYTSLFEGKQRLQGLFSGPFHVALAALVCIAWALTRYKTNRRLAILCMSVGIIGGYLSLVRTFYPALALMLVVFVIVSPNFRAALERTFLLALGGIGLLISALLFPDLGQLGGIASTIFDVGSDERFTNRLPGYHLSMELFRNSPVYGWGSGSAGDTLRFPPGYHHVTSHNILLKFAVEGGLLGLVLWVGLLLALFMAMRRKAKETQLAAMSLIALFGIGLTVSAIDTLPVSFLIFVLGGLACESSKSRSATCVKGS